jgi:signal transduction histidine kinase
VTLRTRLMLLVGAGVTAAGAAVLVGGLVVLDRQVTSSPIDTFTEAAAEFGLDPADSDRSPPPAIRARRAAVQSLRTDDGRSFEQVLDEIDDRRRRQTTQALLVASVIGVVVVGVASAAAGWLVAGRILGPVRAVTSSAHRAAMLDLGGRIDMRGPHDELRELTTTVDEMMGRIDAALAAHRRFAAEVAHELRNPVAVIRSEAELALDEGMDRRSAQVVADEAARCDALIDRFLTLARIQAPPRLNARIDLAELVGDAVGRRVEAASAANVEMQMILDDAEVLGDETLLRVLVDNLVSNAIGHNVPSGVVVVEVGSVHGAARLTVTNSGPAVDPSTDLTAPFERGVASTDGHGLGLSIVKAVVDIHRAELSVAARPAGGLVVTIQFAAATA